MPSPKDIKKVLKTAQGTKAADRAPDLAELLGKLPKGTKAQQLEAELMFKRLQEEQAARYAPTNPPTERGKEALRQAQNQLRERGKQKFLEPSAEKRRMYHGTRHYKPGIGTFDPQNRPTGEGITEFSLSDRGMAFVSPEVSFANTYAGEPMDAVFKSGAVYPVHVQVRNPFDFENADHLDMMVEELSKTIGGSPETREALRRGHWDVIESPPVIEAAKRLGFDGMYMREAGMKNLGVFDPKRIKSAIGNEGTYDIENPDITKAKGGLMRMAGGGKALKTLRGGNKAADVTQDVQSIVSAGKPLTAAERAMVGRLAAEYTANQPVTRLSEALGNVGAEGKKLRVTQTDRTGAKYLGGAPFSMMQKVDPRYAESKATWGVKTPGAAKNITNQADADVIWSTLIGSPTQHRSNELIFDKLYKAFQKSAKEGNLSPELRTKFNAALEPIFGEGADILDPKLRKEIDTFEKRAVVGNLLLGEGLGGAQRGGSIIPGLKIMSETTEPMLRDVETFSIGPRLFTLDQGVISRPDLHPAFPEILTGEDLNQLFVPVPNRIALPTFNEDFMARTGRKKPGYYDLTMTPPGEPYPTQLVDEKYLNFLQREGYAEGGAVHMAGGGDAGEVSGNMFSPKALTIPSPLTDLADAIRRQFGRERRSMSKPGAATDVALRGPVAFAAGTPMDLIGMGGEALDYLQTRIPGLRKKASVMDTGPERTPPMGYAPKMQVGPEGMMPYGTEHFQEKLNQAGLTTGEERPLTELGVASLSPFAAAKAAKYGKVGAKALAPTAMDIMETQLLRATEPMRMNIVPEGGPTSGKVKAPANDLGFYNPAEKAALNLQRKQGPGSAMVSDMKKTPGVNDERLAELGLGDLASRQNVTREELLAAVEQNRIPLRETVRKEGKSDADAIQEEMQRIEEEMRYLDSDSYEYSDLERELSRLERRYEKDINNVGRAKFSPDEYPEYNTPGGENYREIRVALPSNRPSIKNMSRDEYNAAVAKADAEGVNDFTHSTHHGDEPNVLFHLRVADHVDADGKKGLLIDELQSDWHQQGRDKGYGRQPSTFMLVNPETSGAVGNFATKEEAEKFLKTSPRAEEFAQGKFFVFENKGKVVVPDAPFKDNWYQLGLKRAIKEAADTGMDRVYLTTGQRQADRYDLSKQVDSLVLDKSGDGYLLTANRGGSPVIDEQFTDPKKLESLIGKEASKKLLEKVNAAESRGGVQTGKLDGVDLKVGGEGMRQYYDKTYKNFLDKYAKQFGARVGETKLSSATKTRDQLTSNDMHQMMDIPEFKKILDEEFARVENKPKINGRVEPQGNGDFKVVWDDGTFAGGYSEDSANYRAAQGKNAAALAKEAWNAALKKFGGEKVYYIDITPKMRESAKIGQSYKDGGAVRMAEGGAVDYESRFNKMLQDHVGMAQGGAVDYESRFNEMLQKHVKGMAEGGEANPYNEDPDMSDSGQFVQAPAFADGGAVKSIWTVN